jgi:diadenylate cyclase
MFNPFADIRLTDVIDIGFVAVLLYTVIVWLERTRATFVLIGIFIFGAIYILARQLGLQLTSWIFQGFFAIFLVVIVVIFQPELRQIFERIALWSLGPKASRSVRSETLDVLTRTLADFGKERIGALIVIRGNDLLERHILGGIDLDGRISEPLLKSIFDPCSPGHDGAVIVEGDRVSRFAAHLPLSRDSQQLSLVGTRHSAALGLSQLIPFLVVWQR